MPRIFDSRNDAHDFCRRHMPSEAAAEHKYGNAHKIGEGPDGRGNCFAYDAEHPDYDGEEYICTTCRKPLTGDDN